MCKVTPTDIDDLFDAVAKIYPVIVKCKRRSVSNYNLFLRNSLQEKLYLFSQRLQSDGESKDSYEQAKRLVTKNILSGLIDEVRQAIEAEGEKRGVLLKAYEKLLGKRRPPRASNWLRSTFSLKWLLPSLHEDQYQYLMPSSIEMTTQFVEINNLLNHLDNNKDENAVSFVEKWSKRLDDLHSSGNYLTERIFAIEKFADEKRRVAAGVLGIWIAVIAFVISQMLLAAFPDIGPQQTNTCDAVRERQAPTWNMLF